MKAHDNGCFYSVSISKQDVQTFKASWPCSGLPNRAIWAQFDKRNGDLVDIQPDMSRYDGPAILALVQDGQTYAKAKLGIKE